MSFLGLFAAHFFLGKAAVVRNMVAAFEAGLTVRSAGDFLALSPPLIISPDQIGQIADVLRKVISGLA